jgi:hypothetical protein
LRITSRFESGAADAVEVVVGSEGVVADRGGSGVAEGRSAGPIVVVDVLEPEAAALAA